jgi:hypothetical protein
MGKLTPAAMAVAAKLTLIDDFEEVAQSVASPTERKFFRRKLKRPPPVARLRADARGDGHLQVGHPHGRLGAVAATAWGNDTSPWHHVR